METKPRIDVVEDDQAMSRALASLIEVLGFQPRCYRTAHEFLAAYQPGGPACVILDVRLPGLSGLELQEQLVQTGTAPPIIFMTGHGDIHSAELALKRGAVAFLEKPFPSEKLAGAIRQAIRPEAGK